MWDYSQNPIESLLTIFKMKNSFQSLFLLILLLTLSIPGFGQDSLLVEGKITGNKNQAISDVSISVEGADTDPVITDEDGQFRINVSSGDVWLIIQPIGNYKPKRVFLNNRKDIVISLAQKDMVSGYDEIQTINTLSQKRDIIGAHTQLDFEQQQHKNISTIDQGFIGKVPGLFSTNHSGMPGKGTVSFLRGIQSMNASNSPLFIMNGVPMEKQGLFNSRIAGNTYNPLTNIDPFDISSVTILKDPSLTAIYGSKASNGVVLIETLQPQSTETSIDIAAQTGINLSVDFIPQLNGDQYKTLASEILSTSPILEEEIAETYPGLFPDRESDDYYKYIHDTNWQKYVFSDAVMRNVYFSVKGGSEIAKYGLSVGYHDQEGIFKNSRYNRYNVLFVGKLNVFPRFNMDVNAGLTNNNSFLMESALAPETSPIYTSLAKPPIMNPYAYDDEGQQLTHIDEVDELGTSNPHAVAQNFHGENNNYRLIASVKGETDLMNSLKLINLFGLNLNTMEEYVFKPNIGMVDYLNGEARNMAIGTNNYLFSFFTNNYLNYTKDLNSLHQLDATLGFRVLSNSFQEDYGETKNLPANDQFTNLQSGQNNLRWIAGNYTKWNWMSMYNRINYKFKNRYIVSASISADFSTTTGKDAPTAFTVLEMPFGLFYSLGGGWRISDEAFMKNMGGLENLMLRLSYGKTGNNDIGVLRAMQYYEIDRYRETSGLVPGALPNTSLMYESVNQLNTGMDLSLWGGRTSLSINYFMSTTNDLLVFDPLPEYLGFKSKPVNSGIMKNNGLEISFYQRIINSSAFQWEVATDLSFITNEVVEIGEEELITSFPGGQFVSRKGDPLNTFYGYRYEGVYSTFEEASEAALVNEKGIPYGPGDAKFADISGPDNRPDSVINKYDRINLGSPLPEFFGSFTNTLKYRRWSLDVTLQFVYGNEVFNYVRYLNERMVDLSNQSIHVLDRWQYNGQETDVPRALYNDPVGNSDFSSRWIEDGSYVRLKNVTLSYVIPDEFLFFKNASFYITGTNLFTSHQYLGYDPEFSYAYNAMRQGIDYGLMPQYRQYMVGIKLGL
jgi:TonB-linked SusC/RagA family outer membrane protein